MENKSGWMMICDRWIDYLYRLVVVVNKIIFLIMVGSITAAVAGRFVFQKTPKWSEEIGILCLVWLCFLTAQMAVRDGTHIRMTIIELLLPRNIAKVLHVLAYVVIFFVNVLWIIYGAQVVQLSMSAVMPSTRLPMACIYASTAISGLVGIFMVIGRWIRGGF